MLTVLVPAVCAWPAAVPVRVTVSIHPLALLVAEVAGPGAEITTLLPPGASPHGFEPTPFQMRQAAGADLLVFVGGGLDPWTGRIHEALNGQAHLELAAAVGIEAKPRVGERHPGDDHAHGAEDPHLWLDPVLVRDRVVPALVLALSRVRPESALLFRGRGETFRRELAMLDREMSEGLAPYAGRAFVAFHGPWGRFADRYGIRQVAVVEPVPGREPSPRWMLEVIQTARREGATAMVIEPQFNPRVAETIARQFDGRVVQADPLGTGAGEAGTSYAGLMRSNLRAFVEAFAP